MRAIRERVVSTSEEAEDGQRQLAGTRENDGAQTSEMRSGAYLIDPRRRTSCPSPLSAYLHPEHLRLAFLELLPAAARRMQHVEVWL